MSALTRRFTVAPRVPWRLGVALALLLVAAVIGLLVAGSAFSRPAPPFGPAGNGLIPYTSKGDLYLGDPETGSSRLLVTGPNTAAFPGFAPDGTRLVTASRDGTARVWRVSTSGAPVRTAWYSRFASP